MAEGFVNLQWNSHHSKFLQNLSNLRNKQIFTDVTLSCEGQFYPAHRLVLSVCSGYFARTLEVITCPSPVILLHGITANTLEAVLTFIYDGQVTLPKDEVCNLLKAGMWLGINELVDIHNSSNIFKPPQSERQLWSRLYDLSENDDQSYNSAIDTENDSPANEEIPQKTFIVDEDAENVPSSPSNSRPNEEEYEPSEDLLETKDFILEDESDEQMVVDKLNQSMQREKSPSPIPTRESSCSSLPLVILRPSREEDSEDDNNCLVNSEEDSVDDNNCLVIHSPSRDEDSVDDNNCLVIHSPSRDKDSVDENNCLVIPSPSRNEDSADDNNCCVSLPLVTHNPSRDKDSVKDNKCFINSDSEANFEGWEDCSISYSRTKFLCNINKITEESKKPYESIGDDECNSEEEEEEDDEDDSPSEREAVESPVSMIPRKKVRRKRKRSLQMLARWTKQWRKETPIKKRNTSTDSHNPLLQEFTEDTMMDTSPKSPPAGHSSKSRRRSNFPSRVREPSQSGFSKSMLNTRQTTTRRQRTLSSKIKKSSTKTRLSDYADCKVRKRKLSHSLRKNKRKQVGSSDLFAALKLFRKEDVKSKIKMSKSHNCDHCSFSSPNEVQLIQHQCLGEGRIHYCIYCQKMYSSLKRLDSHTREHMLNESSEHPAIKRMKTSVQTNLVVSTSNIDKKIEIPHKYNDDNDDSLITNSFAAGNKDCSRLIKEISDRKIKKTRTSSLTDHTDIINDDQDNYNDDKDKCNDEHTGHNKCSKEVVDHFFIDVPVICSNDKDNLDSNQTVISGKYGKYSPYKSTETL